MKKWQRIWLYAIIFLSLVHLLRDILQEAHVKNILAEILVKEDLSRTPNWYWQLFSTYDLEIAEIGLSIYALRRNKFGFIGLLTILLMAIFITAWSFYWFML